MTDTMRYDMIGCNGKTGLKTPNLDRLVSEGVNFNRAYTTQPVCGSARSAIFTGMNPHSNGAWGNAQALYSNVRTVCKRMRDHGIETGYIGKWHLDGSDYFGNGICPEGCNPKYWYDMRTYLYELSIEERFISRQIETSYRENGIEEEFTYAHRCTETRIGIPRRVF